MKPSELHGMSDDVLAMTLSGHREVDLRPPFPRVDRQEELGERGQEGEEGHRPRQVRAAPPRTRYALTKPCPTTSSPRPSLDGRRETFDEAKPGKRRALRLYQRLTAHPGGPPHPPHDNDHPPGPDRGDRPRDREGKVSHGRDRLRPARPARPRPAPPPTAATPASLRESSPAIRTSRRAASRFRRLVKHPKYGKYVKQRTVLYVHDEKNESALGDTIEAMECRPLSRTKRWRLMRVVKLAPSRTLSNIEGAKSLAGSQVDEATGAKPANPS